MMLVPEPLCYTITNILPVSHLPHAQLAELPKLINTSSLALPGPRFSGRSPIRSVAGGQGNPGTTKPCSLRKCLPAVITGSLTVCGVGNCRQCNGMGVHFQLHLCPGNAEHADGAIAVPCHYMLALSSPHNDGTRLPGQALTALQRNQGRDQMTQ